MQFKKHITDKD